MLKRLFSIALVICVMLSCIVFADYSVVETQAANAYGLAENVQDGQILQCFNWSFNNIKNNMAKIAEQGFSAVQTSPIQASKESTKETWSTCTNSFWVYYQPINYSIETNSRSALGTKDEFKAMCDEAHKYGIKVIVDTVFNHLANNNADNTLCTQIPSDIRDDGNCWHSVTTNISNYSNRYDITHNCLAGLPDLNTGNTKIQNYSISFLKECIDAGADGFRFDAAKHIETPSDYSGTSSDFWPNVLSAATSYAQSTRSITPYYYGEMLDSTGGVDISAYTKYMSVTDNGGSNSIRNAVNSGNAGGAANSAIFNGAQPKYTVQWNESHDTYCEGSSSYVSDTNLKKTWALVGSRAEVCGMYLARPSSGSTKLGNADTTAWADKEVKAINQFKNAFVGQSEYFASSGSIAYNERGTSGVVLVNTGGGSTSVSVTANKMASGTYTDAITGNIFTVSGGRISGSIGSTGIAVVYNPSEIEIPTSTPTVNVTLSGETKTVYVGVIDYISTTPTLHYWDESGVAGDANLVSTGEKANYAVGADYWSNAKQPFTIYKATIPVEATSYKTYDAATSSCWAAEDVTHKDNTILLVFEWGGTYHNQLEDYSVTDPTVEPTEAPTVTPTTAPTVEPTEAPTVAPTEAPTVEPTVEPTEKETTVTGETKTVYVGVIKYITDIPTLHYWNYDKLAGDSELVATGETAEFAVGSSYWSNAAKTFHIYKTTIPAEATHMKTFDGATGSNWAQEEVEYADGKILLVFEWGGTYHNQLADYTPVIPTEAPTVAPTTGNKAVKVTNISTNPTDTNIKFTWDAVEGGFKYWVYKYNAQTDTWASAASAYKNEAVVKLLDADTQYQFKVICKFEDGTMMNLADADIITASTSKAVATSNISGVADVNEATITWDAVEGATKYWVYKATSESGPFYIYNSAYETSCVVRRLRPDTNYYFRVVALTDNNGIPAISDVNASPTVHVITTSATQITTLLADRTASTATISWPQFKNADKYWIKLSETTNDTNETAAWKTVKSTTDINNLTYTFTGLEKCKTYYLTVSGRYYDSDNNPVMVDFIPVEVKTLYSDSDFLTFTKVNDTALTVSWPDDTNAQKTWVYVYDANGEMVVRKSSTTTSATIINLADMENYTYGLYILDNDGKYGFITPDGGEAYHG